MTETSTVPRKIVGDNLYVHIDALPLLPAEWQAWVATSEQRAQVQRYTQFNLVRIDATQRQIALLHYPEFGNDPFPALEQSWRVDLDQDHVSYRTYADSLNPPILHRQELLLSPDDPRRPALAALTQTAEDLGLFADPKRIGYQRQWQALIRDSGYRLQGQALVPLGNAESAEQETMSHAATPEDWVAARQRTALVRYGFSAPIQALARYGLLDGHYSVFDYGCGRGSDVQGLRDNGITASGWDPYYAPDQLIHSADLVNLGFVINVIEDFEQRVDALSRAWALAERLLVVSVMLSQDNAPRGEPFRDGVMTTRGTFQKYFTQAEIKAFLEQVLDEEPIPVAPGVLWVFRDKALEQRFLMERYRSRRNRLHLSTPRPHPQPRTPRRDRRAERYAAYEQTLQRLWQTWLSLGRRPDAEEVANDLPVVLEGFGTLPKALRFVLSMNDSALLDQAAAQRRADLSVYFALNQFERRRPYTQLERGLQCDIKALFGDYATAQNQARELLFRIADPTAIADACHTAAERGLGALEPGQSLQLHVSLVEQLPALLRVYVGCAALLYGDYRHADLVKIHIHSGKLSLMRYTAFADSPLPRMIERVKIKLREQDIEYYAYGEDYEPPFLYDKSRYINEEFPDYPEQRAFEAALDGLDLFDLSGYGPSPAVFLDTLARYRWTVDGFALCRSTTLPNLDDPCGQYVRFRELIECGETQARSGMENRPLQADSYNALADLARYILDPVIDYFGMIRLSYGFCSPALARQIPGRIDPKLDQHAAHERNRLGRLVCPRLGAAVDFTIDDEDMREVAAWIVTHTPFDRLYFYGADRPLHISYGPEHSRQIVLMQAGPSGRRVPRVVKQDRFLALLAMPERANTQ